MITSNKLPEKSPSDKFFPSYSSYPASDDIYQKEDRTDVNPENISELKNNFSNFGKWNDKDFKEDLSGYDLDVPGSELDDVQEEIGSEDEENNYYSIGGDAHHNLDENNE